MRILLVTGKMAEDIVRKNSGGCDVLVIDVDIAAFITHRDLEKIDISGYDLVLVPGLAKGKWVELEKKKGVKIRLGPVHAFDIPKVINAVDKIELSHNIPADRLIELEKEKELIELIERDEVGVFDIGGVQIGGKSRMKIVAEVVDATELEKDELAGRIEYYTECGADIIDLGIPLSFSSDDVRRVMKIARDACSAVSIDTFSRRAVEIGVEQGVDMVMSISLQNLDVMEVIEDQAVVAVDRDVERLKHLTEILRTKTERVIADPVLDLNGLVYSIQRYSAYRKMDPVTPTLFGAGNVTELFDADSSGINALLAYMGMEVGASMLFTTEASVKTRGSVMELKRASYIVKGAEIRHSPPKDLGINLLSLKEKFLYPEPEKPERYVNAERSRKFERDPMGDFRIWISGGMIFCHHENAVIGGKDAKSILDTVLRLNLISRLDHAGYLGRELKKAEVALTLGKNYMQDQPLGFGIYGKIE